MKRITILFIIILFATGCSLLRFVAPRTQKPHKVVGGIRFEYYAPSAKQVSLAGEFNNWEYGNSEKAINLKKTEEGLWWIVVPLKPGRYKYKFVIDNSKWEKDPNGEDTADGNSLVIVE